jgi:hypothetical protein
VHAVDVTALRPSETSAEWNITPDRPGRHQRVTRVLPRDRGCTHTSRTRDYEDELTYLRISRDRARVVLFGCKRVLADHELDGRDLLVIAASLRDFTAPRPTSTGPTR